VNHISDGNAFHQRRRRDPSGRASGIWTPVGGLQPASTGSGTVGRVRLDLTPTIDPGDYDFAHSLRVRFAETDAMGIVHHSRYLPYLEEARVEYLRHLGHPYTELRAEGIDSAVLEVFVQYRQPLAFDEVVTVHLRLGSTTRTTFQMGYLLTVDGEPRATAVTVHGYVTADGRPTRLPAWLVALGSR
jgi:acyl-CoA thioester hydrolase